VALAEIQRLREAGISNLNVDLIAGLAGQTLASWESPRSAGWLRRSPRQRLYVRVDEDSRLGREVLAHALLQRGTVPTDDAVRGCTKWPSKGWRRRGSRQYEISNFCRRNESRHNLRYCSGGLTWG